MHTHTWARVKTAITPGKNNGVMYVVDTYACACGTHKQVVS